MVGVSKALEGEFKDCDLILRTLLSKEANPETRAMLLNNLACNAWLNNDARKSEERFSESLKIHGFSMSDEATDPSNHSLHLA